MPTSIDFNPEFKRALDLMESGESHLFVTGKAGTGKSTLLAHFRDTSRRQVAVVAPTGVAALNVGGVTIHRFFNFSIKVTPDSARAGNRPPHNPKLYKQLQTLVIDEASMVRADLLDCVDGFLRNFGPKPRTPFGGVRLVLVGDLYQLPPVVTSNDRRVIEAAYKSPYFFSAKSLARHGVEIIELQKVYRQKDRKFIDLLNRIRNNTVTEDDMDTLNSRLDTSYKAGPDEFCITLTTTNRNADAINDEKLAMLPGKATISNCEIRGGFDKSSYPTAERLPCKIGAQIMMVNNDSSDRWVNGSIGQIVDLGRDEDDDLCVLVQLRDGGNPVTVRRHKWDVVQYVLQDGAIGTESVGSFTQLPFRLAWAVTIHKSQGKTFDRVVIDLERGAFDSGQTYVALSRCTSFEGIVLRKPVRASSIRCDWRVQKFLTGHQYKISEEEMPFESKMAMIQQAIEKGSRISMTYLKANDTSSKRTVAPVEVGEMEYKGKPFPGMYAFCEMRQEERLFRVDRILNMKILDQDKPS